VFDSLRYTETICLFKQIVALGQQSNEDDTRKQIEHTRSTIHDAVIVSINVLIRSLRAAGKDITWATKMRIVGRPGYAKFAMLVAFEFVLQEREET
jgi:hypothetical protein